MSGGRRCGVFLCGRGRSGAVAAVKVVELLAGLSVPAIPLESPAVATGVILAIVSLQWAAYAVGARRRRRRQLR